MFRRRRRVLVEEGEDANARGDRKRPTSLQLCLQLALVCACIVILFFGLAVTAIGFWGYSSQQDYLTITNRNSELTRLPFSMMVTGGFVAILGLVGVIGSLFSRTITGQTLLGVFSFVLVLVIISEVGAGAAAVRLKFNLETVFINTAYASQREYVSDGAVAKEWDTFQETHGCCGARGYVDDTPPYQDVFNNESVPISCCKADVEHQDCEDYAKNATEYREYIYNEGCPSVAMSDLTRVVTVIAIVAITIGSTQLLAVLLAVVVAYMSSKLDGEKSSSYSYNKLLQQEELAQEDNSQPVPT